MSTISKTSLKNAEYVAVMELLQELFHQFKHEIKAVILFGSAARCGQRSVSSDVDIVIKFAVEPTLQQAADISNTALRLNQIYKCMLSVFVWGPDLAHRHQVQESFLWRSIQRDGIVLPYGLQCQENKSE